jgi:hypothetical protein
MGMLASSMTEKEGTDVHEFIIHHTKKFFIFSTSEIKKEIQSSYNFPP